jgi:hypothetical protein
MIIIAADNVGVLALYLLLLWLGSAIVGTYISERKGYGDKPGLASGLLLSVIGAAAWLLVPAKSESDWKVIGPFPWQRAEG